MVKSRATGILLVLKTKLISKKRLKREIMDSAKSHNPIDKFLLYHLLLSITWQKFDMYINKS